MSLAFNDINPLSPTHILVIPKGPYVSWDDFSAKASDEEIARVRSRGRQDRARRGPGRRAAIGCSPTPASMPARRSRTSMSTSSPAGRSGRCSRANCRWQKGDCPRRVEPLGFPQTAIRGELMASAAPRRGILGRMMLRKSVAQIQEETRTSELKRSLGPWNLVFLGIGCIIGAGIFVRTGNAAALHAGPAVLISYAIAGIICAFAGLCYAELASTLPVSGSAYTYSYATIGEFAAWVMGALLLLEYGLAASVVAVGWSGYVVSLLRDFGLAIPATLTGPTGSPFAEGRGRRARERRAGRLHVQPAGLPGLLRPCHPACHRRFGMGQVQQRDRRHQGDRADRLHPRRRLHHPQESADLHAQLASVHSASRPAPRASSGGAESFAPPRSSSSPISGSKRSRPPARKPRTRARTCRSGSSARSSRAP